MKRWQAYLVLIIAPLVSGVLTGWHYRKPSAALLRGLGLSSSEWKKELKLERFRMENMELFNNDAFVFNWLVAVITVILVFLVIKWHFGRKEWL